MADPLPGLQGALQQIWRKNLPQTRERLALLAHVAQQMHGASPLPIDLHTEAHATAHKLAGSLGMFGHAEATEHARAIEHLLQPQNASPRGESMSILVEALYASLGNALEGGGN